MEKILLEYDKLNHLKLEKFLNDDLLQYQKLFNAVKANFKGFDGTLETLEDVISNAPMFLLDQLVSDEDLHFKGLPISKAKALEMVDFPAEFKEIIEAAKEFKGTIKKSHRIGDDTYSALSITDIAIVAGKLEIKKECLTDLKNKFCVYTRNERQNDAVYALRIVIDQLEVLKKLGLWSRELTMEAIGIDISGEKPRIDRYKLNKVK